MKMLKYTHTRVYNKTVPEIDDAGSRLSTFGNVRLLLRPTDVTNRCDPLPLSSDWCPGRPDVRVGFRLDLTAMDKICTRFFQWTFSSKASGVAESPNNPPVGPYNSPMPRDLW